VTDSDQWATSKAGRPEVALITNHGYAGVDIPFGGAPDTGGQNFYVNQLAVAFERVGYRVTIFARGGFPRFGGEGMREGTEKLSDDVRYVYVPGGGDEFIRKEDIAVALDEEVSWLVDFVREQARLEGCEPWEVYELVNTHYWDAAVMGVRLVEKWRDEGAARFIADTLEGAVDDERLERLVRDCTWLAVGSDPAYHAGDLLAAHRAPGEHPSRWAPEALGSWARSRGLTHHAAAVDALAGRFARQHPELAPVLLVEFATRWLGEAALELADPEGELSTMLARMDTHVWTPHSLGELKDLNYRNKSVEQRRDLKFCERRDHERMVCDRTRAFAATSGEIAEHLMTRYGVRPSSLFYFPPCVDRDIFRPYSPEERASTYRWLSDKTGLGVDELASARIVFETSRQDATKRKDLLLQAFARAAEGLDDVYLLIGGGPENDVFDSLRAIRDSDEVLSRQAFLLGFVPDEVIYPLFDIADVFVTPSEMEGFGMSASQAAAAGTALVSSDLVPFSVLYVPQDALVVAAGDLPGFADAIRRLLDDPEERSRRGDALREATARLDWVVQTRAFVDHLRSSGIDVAEPAEPEEDET
jgi:glycosyltransferase involved in cell wall biosynthesis